MTEIGGPVQAIMSTYFLPSLARGPAVAAQCAADEHYLARNDRTLEDTERLLFCANVGNRHFVRSSDCVEGCLSALRSDVSTAVKSLSPCNWGVNDTCATHHDAGQAVCQVVNMLLLAGDERRRLGHRWLSDCVVSGLAPDISQCTKPLRNCGWAVSCFPPSQSARCIPRGAHQRAVSALKKLLAPHN